MYNGPILLDLHLQRDLVVPGGRLYHAANRRATANAYRLFNWAKANGTPVVSVALMVRPNERGPFSREAHLVEGSGGELKPARTLLPRRINLGLSHNADLPPDIFRDVQQIIFETRDADVFHHEKFERLVTELPKECTFIICGATVAMGVKQAVLGLRSRQFNVVVAEDALLGLDHPRTEMAWLQIMAKEAWPLTTERIIRDFSPVRRHWSSVGSLVG